MQPHEWGIIGGLVSILFTVAGYLASKVIGHGEAIAGLLSHKEDIAGRLDRQDGALDAIDRKLDLIMFKFNIRTTPPGGIPKP